MGFNDRVQVRVLSTDSILSVKPENLVRRPTNDPPYQFRPTTAGPIPALGLCARRAKHQFENSATGQGMESDGKLQLDSPEGYVENVLIYDERHSRRDIFVAHIHRQAIRVLCGNDSLEALENMPTKRLTATAFLVTGGDGAHAEDGLAGYLHIITGPPQEPDPPQEP